LKNKIIYTLLFLLTLELGAQVRQFSLSKGGSQVFGNQVYCFGIAGEGTKTAFCVYKLDPALTLLDSFSLPTGNLPGENFLPCSSDTLHGYLNIYFHSQREKSVSVLRFNRNFELLTSLKQVEVARLNNQAVFSQPPLYYHQDAYAIRTEPDSSGRQFYLNKYRLKSDTENFDYQFQWQFPFERKHIRSARVFLADQRQLMVFVDVAEGSRAGQWILKISSSQGQLLKATRLNAKEETGSCFYSSHYFSEKDRSLHLVGQKFTEAQLDLKGNKLQISNASHCSLYYIEIDSLGEVTKRQDIRFPIQDIKTGTAKTANSYLLRCYNLLREPDGSLSFYGDLFRGAGKDLCFLYTNTGSFRLAVSDEGLIPGKNSLSPNLQIESYYVTADRLDMNGRLCIDSLSEFGRFFYKSLTFPVKQQFKYDPDKNPVWLLSKHTLRNNLVDYSLLSPVKKIYKISLLQSLPEAQRPSFIQLGEERFIISSQPEASKYQLKLFNW
jgi:hypothetical protein